jgi:hypothetical protein
MDTSLSLVGYQIGVHFFQPTSIPLKSIKKDLPFRKIRPGRFIQHSAGERKREKIASEELQFEKGYGTFRLLCASKE